MPLFFGGCGCLEHLNATLLANFNHTMQCSKLLILVTHPQEDSFFTKPPRMPLIRGVPASLTCNINDYFLWAEDKNRKCLC